MIAKTISLLMLVTLTLLSCSNSRKYEKDSFGKVLKNGQFYDMQEETTREVWICTGKSSHAYHSTDECYGIQACRADIERITIDEALAMGRTPCHYCHEGSEGAKEEDEEDFDPDTYDPENDTYN